jgi:MarR family transcriptional regulator for hemolysin
MVSKVEEIDHYHRRVEQEGPFLLGYLIHDVSRLRFRFFDRLYRNRGFTRSQWWTLGNISLQGKDGVSQGELARTMDVKKAMMGAMIDQLEEAGLVRREAGSEDRRVKAIKMTEAGQALSQEMFGHVKNATPRFHDQISDEDLAITLRTLKKIRSNIRAVLKEDGADCPG